MKQSVRLFTGLLVPALMLAFATATPAMKHEMDKAKDAKAAPAAKAEKGKPTITVLAENDKAKAFTVQYKPGDENKTIANTATRVVRALKGGTITRTYADGKTEKAEWKTGEVKIRGAEGPYTAKNTGKTEILLYIVQLK